MKLTKINLSQLANADLNEREMCRLLGGGDPGCCQCSCAGSSTTATNNSWNNKDGLTSVPTPTPPQSQCFYGCQVVCTWNCNPVDNCKPKG